MLVGFEIAGKFGVVDLPRTVFATGCRQARCQQLPTSVIRHQVALAPEIDGRVELPADDDACRQAMPTATHSYSRTSPFALGQSGRPSRRRLVYGYRPPRR